MDTDTDTDIRSRPPHAGFCFAKSVDLRNLSDQAAWNRIALTRLLHFRALAI